MRLINVQALWAHALSEARATYNPEQLDEPVHVYRGTNWWFDVPLDLTTIIPGSTIGVMLPGKGWIYAHPQTSTGCPGGNTP